MPYTASDGRRAALAALALALNLVLAACSYVPPPAWPREALPLPEEIATRYAVPSEPIAANLDTTAAAGVVNGELTCGDQKIRFHLQEHRDPKRPVVLLVPILAGGEDLMRSIARRIVARGFHAAWCERAGSAMRPPQRGPELEQLFQRTVIQQRILLAWLRDASALQPRACFALGVSMGGIISSVLAAVEPNLEGTAICLAGADLPSIVMDSEETRVARWRDWRLNEDGIGKTSLLQELQTTLLSDPGRLGPFVDTQSVLLVHATMDEVIRRPHQDLLWESLGRPRRLLFPLGHTTAALAIDPILDAAASFFREREPVAPSVAAGPVSRWR
jgi:pimeloyl-ACP methyl ester carboxylesterase